MIQVNKFVFLGLSAFFVICVASLILLWLSSIRYKKQLKEKAYSRNLKKINTQIVELNNDILSLKLEFQDFKKRFK